MFLHFQNFSFYNLICILTLTNCSFIPDFVSSLPLFTLDQCCGSKAFWCGSGSGSADPRIYASEKLDLDPDPAIFVIDLQDANKKLFKKKFFCVLLFEGTFSSFFVDKKSKRSHKVVRIKVFLTIFAW